MHPKGANSMAVSGPSVRKVLVGTGRAFSVIFRLRNKPSCLVGPPFPAFMTPFSATASWHFPGLLQVC